jgi:spore coat protein A, manganese oxidase
MKPPSMYKICLISGLVALFVVISFSITRKGVTIDPFYPGEKDVFQSGVIYEPFTVMMPNPIAPENIFQPVDPFPFQCSIPKFDGIKQFRPKFYQIEIKEGTAEIVPGRSTPIWGYEGQYPGPSFRAFHNEPVVVRYTNHLNQSITLPHLHGMHVTSASDGNPTIEERLILPNQSKDFCYPNNAPIEPTGIEAIEDFPSTMWYHDHTHEPGAEIGVTGRNVYMGLAGVYITEDELERDLIDSGVLPSRDHDVYMVIQDKAIKADGELIYEPEAVNYDGVLGDIPVVNGKAQPFFNVERRKYRFRFLNGSTARFIQLRMTHGLEFTQIGADSWLLGEAVVPTASDDRGTRVGEIRLTPAERADVIVDFTNAPDEVFLENVLFQENGRRPDDVVDPGTFLVQFKVSRPKTPVVRDATITVGDVLRPHTPITQQEIRRTRVFEFERRNGRWAVNKRFFDHHRVEANPTIGTAERWILRDKSGGWAHPIHIHDEAVQIQRVTGRAKDAQEMFKKDTVRLQPNTDVEVFIKFRTYPGRFVFHCHNNEHEDSAMMLRYDVVERQGLREAQTVDKAQLGPGQPPLDNWSFEEIASMEPLTPPGN